MARGRTGKRGSAAGKRRTQKKRMTKCVLTGGTNKNAPNPKKNGWSLFKSKPTAIPVHMKSDYNPDMDPELMVTPHKIAKTNGMRYQGVGGAPIGTQAAFAMQKQHNSEPQSVESVSHNIYNMAKVVTKIQAVSEDKGFRTGNEGYRARKMANALAGMGIDPTKIEGFKTHVNPNLIQAGTPGTLNSTIRPENVIRFAQNKIGKRTIGNKVRRFGQILSPISV